MKIERKHMNILTLQNIEKSYGTRLLFKNVNVTIASHHRIGLIGVNGTGKTTLLQVLEGTQEPDTGSIERNGKATIHRLEQDPYIDKTTTLLDNVPWCEILKEPYKIQNHRSI